MNILAFFAHPDDETMLCGGTLALLARAGAQVHLLIATRGEGGENGEPPVCSREELGEVRAEEMRCAAKQLGAASLRFLSYIDPLVGPDNTLYAFTEDEETLTAELVEALQAVHAEALISHGSNGEYGHPAHRLCHRAARKAIERLGTQAPLFYTIQATHPEHPRVRLANPEDPAHLILDTQSVHDIKVAAALCHRTQHALFIRNTSRELGRPVTVPEVIRDWESLHRVYPPVHRLPVEDELTNLLRATGSARDPVET
ncbi:MULTISPECIES: PIG-L deacetylase family protein [Anaerolinea]|uniref:PIG-L deacetylase family protein n=1 Tax=Anaerolinea TaxID=233189 RepID=UPI002609AA96|nr:PIG-L deacetylase family protein [Anaerolinea thermophila]